MKNIKLRAWYEEEKEMQRVTDIYFNKKTGEIESFVAKGKKCNYHTDFDNHKLMQYTGIEDENGVEIYEGDIVKLIIDEFGSDIGVIKFEMGGFVIDYKNLDTEFEWLYYVQDDCDIEVIGNIYENNDLLEG